MIKKFNDLFRPVIPDKSGQKRTVGGNFGEKRVTLWSGKAGASEVVTPSHQVTSAATLKKIHYL
jgi:hypothetical protein